MKFCKKLKLLSIMLLLTLSNGFCDNATRIDNRIKTYIYNENEVFLLVVHYGFQSSVEFATGEEIETLSVGDSYAWKITPIGKRLFIKPLEENIRTNMTIITNKRTYQFDIVSKLAGEKMDKELAYVVRFYYPGLKKANDQNNNNNNNDDNDF